MKSIKNIKRLVTAGLLLQIGINFAYNNGFMEQGLAIMDALNEQSNKNDSKLIIAAEKGNLKDLEVALNDPKVNVDEIGEKSCKTALMLASENGHKPVVEILLGKGANPHILSAWGSSSALREAVKGNYVGVVKLLLRDKRVVDAHFRLSLGYALIEAVIKGRKDMVKLLLDNGADPNVEGTRESNSSFGSTSALIEAVIEGHKDMVELFLGNDADIDMQGGEMSSTALMVASSKGNEAMIKLLLDKGADPNLRDIHGNTALDRAKHARHRAIIQPFMNKEESNLMSAVVNGDLKAVKAHIAAGVNVDAKDGFGFTPLIKAAELRCADTVKALMVKVANISHDSLETAFMTAVYRGDTEVVKALMVEGANIKHDTLETGYMIALNQRKTEVANAIKDHLRKTQ